MRQRAAYPSHPLMSTSSHYPRYHLRPPTMWVNDPNGPLWVGDTVHLFCQYNPHANTHGTVHWAHFTSGDLVRWQLQPPALTPAPGGADADGCWSGAAVLDDGRFTLVYTGYRAEEPLQTVCLATTADGGRTWVKDPANPVLDAPAALPGLRVFRDPFLWRDEAGWNALVGAGVANGRGAVLLHRGPALRGMSYVGPLCSADSPALDGRDTGTAWECPQLARFGDAGLLLVSAWNEEGGPSHVEAVVGELTADRLEPRHVERFDFGPDLYAPALLQGSDGRCLVWGWSWEARPAEAARDEGWAGVLTLPREVRLGPDGLPRIAPAAELAALRGPGRSWAPLPLQPGEQRVLEPASGDSLEVVAVLRPLGPGRCWLRLRLAPDAGEYTEVGVDAGRGEAYVDRERASLSREVDRGCYRAPVDARVGQEVRLRVFLDRSIVEVFVDDRRALTARIYPTRADSLGLAVGSSGAAARVESLQRWRLPTADLADEVPLTAPAGGPRTGC